MKQLVLNLFLTLCVVVALLVILGVKRNFDGAGEGALLSQPSEKPKATAPRPDKGSPRPRVLQAKPIAQQEHAILSPTNSAYVDSETKPWPTSSVPIAPILAPQPGPASRPLGAPDLVPVAEPMTSPPTFNVGDTVPNAVPFVETPTVPLAAQPLPEFVLTDSEDSFWSISERVYGSGAYYRALFRHNAANVLRPDQLRAGVEVRTPPLKVLRELYPADFPQDPPLTP